MNLNWSGTLVIAIPKVLVPYPICKWLIATLLNHLFLLLIGLCHLQTMVIRHVLMGYDI
jgi:hypothetical protein